MPSRTPLAALAVASRDVPPMEANTAPIDCWANLPVEKVRTLSVPETGVDTVWAAPVRTPGAALVDGAWVGSAMDAPLDRPAASGAVWRSDPAVGPSQCSV